VTFGVGGGTFTDFGYGTDVIEDMTVLDNGKILVAGYAYNGSTIDFALARYDSDGTLDTTFGSGGKTTTHFGYGTDVINDMTMLDNGKILVAGYAYNGSTFDFALARYNDYGNLDKDLTTVVTGLANGTAYTFTVTATNSIGTSTSSDASDSVTTPTAPGVPTDVSATPSDTSAVVSWTAPSSYGGSPITLYTVTSEPGGLTASTAGTSATVTGLTQITAYTFTVTATNAAGTSASSAPSSSVTTLLTNIWDVPSMSQIGTLLLVLGMLGVFLVFLIKSGPRTNSGRGSRI
jgi:uncharacterized delta-60 repeat protein